MWLEKSYKWNDFADILLFESDKSCFGKGKEGVTAEYSAGKLGA